MHIKTTRLSSKGQITLPIQMLRAMNAGQGTEFVVVQDDDRIILMKADAVGKRLTDDLADLPALATGAFHDLWDNEADAVWDDA